MDKEIEKRILGLYISGLSDKQIADKIGHYPSYVQQFRSKYGLEKNPTKLQREIAVLYSKGMSTVEIAKCMKKRSTYVRHTLQKMKLLEVQKPSERKCLNCGQLFIGRDDKAKYCCKSCQREASHKVHDAERRSRLKSAIIDTDITLPKLIERDKSICYICGEPVDLNDYKIVKGRKKPLKMYPSIDHVVPLIEGGSHSWENVKLAHLRCNAKKGARK
jgi:DNA-binding CsgD family transcriptional regulator